MAVLSQFMHHRERNRCEDQHGEVFKVIKRAKYLWLNSVHYHGVNALQSQYGNMGFQALGFPCDQFYNQQPESNGEEILNGLKYVRPGGGFVPNFQMFGLVEINGKNEHPLFTYLKKYCPPTSDTFQDTNLLLYSPLKVSDIRWNFEQFLIDKNGKPYMRYSSETDPMALKPEIQRMLQTKPETEDSLGLRRGV